jgi:cytoskeleton-associated protein 5
MFCHAVAGVQLSACTVISALATTAISIMVIQAVAANCKSVIAPPCWHLQYNLNLVQVMSKQYDVIRSCTSFSTFTRREAFVAITGAVDKLADIKLKGPAFEMLLAASEAVGPQFVSSLLHKKAAVHKNPKVLTEALNWLSQAIQEFGLASFSIPAVLEWAKADLGSSTPAVRTAAVALLGTMHSFVGPALAEMVRPDVKPALWTTVETRFQDCPQQTGFEAKRQSR